MTQQEVAGSVRKILIEHFNILPDHFFWEIPLEKLDENFKILSYLVFLEQLVRQEFGEKIEVLEEISTAFHTPQDIVDLILKK